MSLTTVLLLDLDGVLVEPGGYRAAVDASLRHTFRRWGWPLTPPADLPERFEAVGITSEWDMVPLTLAAALEAWVAAHGTVPRPAVLEPQGGSPGPWGDAPTPDFAAVPERLAPHLQPGVAPAEVAWRQGLFPHLGRTSLAHALLAHTRQVLQAPTTRLFQHFTLGSQVYAETYAQPPAIVTPSLLQRHDRPLLRPALRDALRAAQRQGRLGVAVYTARPSLPPRGTPRRPGYAPEAELALDVVGWPEAPLIGFGRLQALAEDLGESSGERFVKPAPAHALAALLAALSGDERIALRATAAWLQEGRPPQGLLPADGLRLVVVEDSPAGLRAATAAAEQARAAGAPVDVCLLGVTRHPAKRRGLEAAGAQVFPDVNQALDVVWQREGKSSPPRR